MRSAIGLVGLAACVSAGCGRSWSDPWTGDTEIVDALSTEDNMDRGGFGPDGRFWAVAVPSDVAVSDLAPAVALGACPGR